jgi:hypothetical protein
MIGDQHVGPEAAQILEAFDLDRNAAGANYHPRPNPGDLAGEVVIAETRAYCGGRRSDDGIEHRYQRREQAPYQFEESDRCRAFEAASFGMIRHRGSFEPSSRALASGL